MAKVFESSLEGAMKAIAVSAQLTEQGYPVPIMLLGNPGAAKSAFVRIFSELMGFEFLNIEAASRQPEDFFGYMTTPDKVEGKMVEPSLIVPDYYTKVKEWVAKGKKGILFFDEINTAPQHVQAVALGLIQERKFRDITLPNTVTIVAAGNYFENLNADDMVPLAPVLNRFCILNIKTHVSMSGKDDFAVMQRLLESIDDHDTQYTFEDAYRDVYSNMLSTVMTKALTPESPDDRNMRFQLEKVVGVEIINTIRRMCEVDNVIDINDKHLASLYTDAPTPDNDVYNFVSPRSTMNLIKMIGGYYSMWGIDSLTSAHFSDVINGLCGLAPAKKAQSSTVEDTKYVTLGKELWSSIKQATETFKLKSDKKIDKKLKLFSQFITRAEEQAAKNKKKVAALSEDMFNDLKEYFKSFSQEITDVTKPIEEKTLVKFFELLMNVPKVNDNFAIPQMSAGSTATTFASLDPSKKLEYINTKVASDFQHWSDWWSVVNEFIETFGNPAYGYTKVLPSKELVKAQVKATKFFNSVIYTASVDFTEKDLDVQVQGFIKNTNKAVIDSAFGVDSEKTTTLFRSNS